MLGFILTTTDRSETTRTNRHPSILYCKFFLRAINPPPTDTSPQIMVIAFLQVLQESVKKLLPDAEHKTTQLPTAAIAALAGTVIVKGIIWIGCARVDGTQVKALSQGRSDVSRVPLIVNFLHRLQTARPMYISILSPYSSP